MTEYVKIYSGSFMLVQRVVNELNEAGIDPIVKEDRLVGFGSLNSGIQDVYVHENDLNRATPIVKSMKLQMEQ